MAEGEDFETNVFVNCPFDKDYDHILQAILFCIVYLGFEPRIATEREDAGESRLEKIRGLIRASKYSVHDLSRCQATEVGQLFRLNMPFELGVDYGCRQFGSGRLKEKKILILEREKYRYLAAISDLAGSDIQAHGEDWQKAVRKLRNWLVGEAGAPRTAPAEILGAWADFQEWYYERQLAAGFSDEDIQDYPTVELLDAMKEWVAAGKPV